MTAPSDGNDPWRFAFWNKRNRERTALPPFQHRKHHAQRTANRRAALAQIAFDLFVVAAWILLIVLAVFFPSDVPDPRFGPYG